MFYLGYLSSLLLLLAAGEQQRSQWDIPSCVPLAASSFCSRGRPIAASTPANRPNAHLQRTDDAWTMTSTVQRGILRRPGMIDRIVVMTISWLSALIIYDGWDILRFVDVAAIILGPIAAIFAAHVFAGTLTERVRLGRGSPGV